MKRDIHDTRASRSQSAQPNSQRESQEDSHVYEHEAGQLPPQPIEEVLRVVAKELIGMVMRKYAAQMGSQTVPEHS